ncbi:hypothetical protein QIH85_43090 [Bradyrhizobium japonicum]|uniref:hypothetical protein n=1 Tax=Bradyrhizobium japonicum TaxID=375 RepID=UPI001E62354A|nr:hypothetical protein [Bradyrhizobium japonicum]MCD9898257.1 hypothetical protein [Bradyrhizobium japonicum]WLB28518.1 hypothetical protein QIH85_43090 [Bradyrhizobium japonicum]WRJ84728.1 hypothetical protein R3F78_07565 [Bradyrhizobium japonicum]WRJ93698.1 hypothetical protein R3F77_05275 [Bradyrhizobium japonicum]WRK47550.1 hypothetical protein R3F73_05335 [Bradyrhizobium japonicum]
MTKLFEKLMSFDEYRALGDRAVADGLWRNDRRVFLPGVGWFNDWYLDRDLDRDFLPPHYYRDWAGKRLPIELVCPDGNIWCADSARCRPPFRNDLAHRSDLISPTIPR